MRSVLLLSAVFAALSLAACGEVTVRKQEAPEAAADAAAVDDALAAQESGTPSGRGDQDAGATPAGAEDARGTTGTTPPDGSGKPGVTLPTLPPETAGDTPPTAPPA